MAAVIAQSDATPITWVNGVLADQVSIFDRGLAYGDGLFETMRYQAGAVPLWPWHFARLSTSAERLLMPVSVEAVTSQLHQVLADLISAPRLGFGSLKLIVTRGNGQGYGPVAAVPNYYWLYRPIAASVTAAQQGICLQVSSLRLARSARLGGLKHLNRLEYVLAAHMPLQTPTDQWLLLDELDLVVEALTHNIVWLRDGVLFTPELSYCGVAGVMREWILQRARAEGREVQISSFNLTDLLNADEVFLCNSLRGIWPVRQIEQTLFNPGPITRQYQSAIDSLWQ